MSSEVSICNQAISWLGITPGIISLSDNSKAAKLCNANYTQLRDTVLEEGKWGFATLRQIFQTPLATPPVYGYGKAYLIPTTTLLIIECNSSGKKQGDMNLDWRKETNEAGQNIIVTDADVVYAKTIVQVTDPKKFTNTFRQAFAARIAAELAVPLTESTTKETKMWELYGIKIDIALGIDGMQGKSDRIQTRSGVIKKR